MRKRNLLKNPCWEGKDLGQALPNSPHAVSVALPRWSDVIDYEENSPTCIQSLKSIYPRFGQNPLIKEISNLALEKKGLNDYSAWPYPNAIAAQKAKEYCIRLEPKGNVLIKQILGLECLLADNLATPFAKSFWQHTGLGASSRQASIALKKEPGPTKKEGNQANSIIKERLAKIYEVNKDLISLHPSGMAALTTILEAVSNMWPGKPTLQVGFPYVDVLKLPQKVFHGGELLLRKDINNLEKELRKLKPSALIVEVPSNPMLECLDIIYISEIAHKNGVLIIADDTIGSPLNINLLPYVDIVFSSLTKSFAGIGDILAGSLVISPYSSWLTELKDKIKNSLLSELSDSDSIALEKASRDVSSRVKKLNDACFSLKNKLEQHPEILKVLHPSKCKNFKHLMRKDAGHGCLLSIEIKGGLEKTKNFYDKLKVCKGPSLGTAFTLVCPYVLLAHYKELDWAKKAGIPPYLLRISVGLEDEEELWDRFRLALEA